MSDDYEVAGPISVLAAFGFAERIKRNPRLLRKIQERKQKIADHGKLCSKCGPLLEEMEHLPFGVMPSRERWCPYGFELMCNLTAGL